MISGAFYQRGISSYTFHSAVDEDQISRQIRATHWTNDDAVAVPALEPVLNDTNRAWLRVRHTTCSRTTSKRFYSIRAAARVCLSSPESCSGIYDNGCDATGEFTLCAASHDFTAHAQGVDDAGADCIYMQPTHTIAAKHWESSFGPCPVTCDNPKTSRAECLGTYEEYTYYDLTKDSALPIVFMFVSGVLAYCVFGLLLHIAHINDGIARNAAGDEITWKEFLRSSARSGIKSASKELTEALANGEESAVAALVKETKFSVRKALLTQHCSAVGSDGKWSLDLSRSTLFEDIVANLRDGTEIHYTTIRVDFIGERGQDVGGITRDMFTLFGRRFKSKLSLLVMCRHFLRDCL